MSQVYKRKLAAGKTSPEPGQASCSPPPFAFCVPSGCSRAHNFVWGETKKKSCSPVAVCTAHLPRLPELPPDKAGLLLISASRCFFGLASSHRAAHSGGFCCLSCSMCEMFMIFTDLPTTAIFWLGASSSLSAFFLMNLSMRSLALLLYTSCKQDSKLGP